MKTKTKRIYLLIFALVAMVSGAKAESTAYAVYSNGTLTFMYGEKPKNETYCYDVSNTGERQPWEGVRDLITKVVFDSSFASARPKSCCEWFIYMSNLTTITDIGYLNTSNVTNMSLMFFHCSSLTWLDLRRFDTSNVTSMASMFAGCKSLVSLDLRGIETSKVTNMYGMFDGCESLTSLDLRSFNTSNVENMGYMFYGDGKLTTIYCNDTWTCASSEKMFWFCVNLKGAITISQSKNKDVADANPNTGFFTSKLETYNLSINGTSVTDVNQWNLARIDGVEGTAYFYDATKTLTLIDTQIAASESNVNSIESRLDTLYIEVYGECSLSSKLSAGIAGLSHIVIKGDGLLVVSGYGAIYWLNQSKSLTVEGGVKVIVQGTNLCAIGACQSIKVKGSETYLNLRGAKGSCEKVNELKLSDGLAILSPSGAKFNGSTIVDKDGNAIINDWVAIGYQYYEPGDVNHDGVITMADANKIVNYFLATDKPEDFDVKTADVNEDGTITMADANKIVNMFLGQ